MTSSDLNSTPHYNQIYFKGGSHRSNVMAARMRYFLYTVLEKKQNIKQHRNARVLKIKAYLGCKETDFKNIFNYNYPH